VTGIIFIGSNFTVQDKSKTNQTQKVNKVIDLNNYKYDNKIKSTQDRNIKKVVSLKSEHINPPNININKLVFDLTQVNADSFTIAEISKHTSRNDCYLIINNNVYDVSLYISYHPGGSKIITSRCGKEVTGIFASIHSNRAWDLLKKYKIGTININESDTTFQVLTVISDALKEVNPNAEIVNVRPKKNFYIAKIIYKGKLHEVHIDNNGQIIKEEIENNESNWSLWENDKDDR
jgi:cytochrome b involved in lipid metabolism